MIDDRKHSSINYCDDSQLTYKDNQTEFYDGQSLKFDEAYRLAHLPLVAPDHPLVLPSKPGSSYYKGVHELIYSIAVPISADDLMSSEKFIKFYKELKSTKFAHKLSWDTFGQRKNKLHATVCGSMSIEQEPYIHERVVDALSAIGPIAIKIRGVFSGNKNIGRLYLKLYPEQRGNNNMFHEIQKIFGTPSTNLYVVGLLNFVEELDVSETQELREFLVVWQDCEFAQLSLENLWLLKSRDDLVLDGSVAKILPLF